MERDYAYRFSDETYLNKEEVKKTLNLTAVDYIWDTIIEYRKLYFKVLDIFSNERKPFSLCLCVGINNKIIKLERRIANLFFSRSKYKNIMDINYKNILKTMCDFNGFNDVNDATIEGILNQNIVNYPRQYNIVNNYYLCLKDIKVKHASPLNENTIKRLYSILLYGMSDFNDNLAIFRINEVENFYDSTLNYRHYEGAEVSNINTIMDNLIDYIGNNNEYSLINAAIIYFNIMYFKPFECFNEEMALLLTKYYLAHENEDLVYLNIENTLKYISDDLKRVFTDCERYLDLTYFANYFLNFLAQEITNEEKYVNHIEEMVMQNEVLKLDDESENSETVSLNEVEHQIEVPKKVIDTSLNSNRSSSLIFKQKVSMPVLPSGLDEKDASIVAENLLELNPTLKKGQAMFYSRHCTIGKYYTIQQYKQENNVAYETARTSMDNLCYLGFYKKEKIRNKFVYTPVIRS